MVKTLSPGAVHVRVSNLQEAVDAARRGGFEGLEFSAAQVADLGAERALETFGEIKPMVFGLPVEWRKDEETFQQGLAELPRLAKAAAGVGCTRTATWVISGSDERPMEENVKFHVARFGPIAQVLADHGISLGLEFIGPKTLRDKFVHPFVYTMDGMLDLGRQIGPNVGLLLDCWHWYTSGGTVEDLHRLKNEQVLFVHVNDAPEGVHVDEQVDNVRRLPGQTGVIDIAGFLGALNTIGYDGPIAAEPFYDDLQNLPSDDERLRTIKESLDTIFGKAGL